MKKFAIVKFVTAATCTARVLQDFILAATIIDEASQMMKVASVSVMANFFSSVQKVIMADDLKQNHPFIESFRRNEFFKITERKLTKRMLITEDPSMFLKTQYRMHSHVSMIVSGSFYQDRLIDGENVTHQDGDEIFRPILPVLTFSSHISLCRW